MTTSVFVFFLPLLLLLLLPLSPPAKASIFIGNGGGVAAHAASARRVLHQPLFPVDSSPPPAVPAAPAPPQDPTSDWPFFQPGPPGATTTPSVQGGIPPPSVPSSSSSSSSNGYSSQQRSDSGRGKLKPLLAVAGSIAVLLILSCLVLFFFCRSRGARPDEPEKVVARAVPTPSPPPPAVEVMNRRDHGVVASRSVAPMSEIYRPSPELQPMSPLNKAPIRRTPIPAIFSDEETTSYYSPHNTSVTLASEYAPTPDNNNNSNHASAASDAAPAAAGKHRRSNSAHSCRTSPRSRLSTSSGDGKVVQSPSHHLPSPAPPPGAVVDEPVLAEDGSELLPPPPPPPPPPPIPRPPKHVGRTSSAPPPLRPPRPPSPPAEAVAVQLASVGHKEESSCRAVEENEAKLKLKPLHWDKVKASSDRATVWDQLKSGSFQLNENMIETLFVSNGNNTAQKEGSKRPGLPSLHQEDKVLDPKKSQNIAILLRALNVNQEVVTEALLDGDHGGLSTELLENLVKMAPTKEEEIKLVNYNDDVSKLDSAERFLKSLLDIPFAFKRVDAMVYRANFESEIKYLMQTFETLEAACEELKTSRLFLKLLEAVLRTGNRMNVGTFRGEAMAFKLDTLLKLVDVKGTDGKTTLLHFVVQEIIRSEALGSEDSRLTTKEGEFRKQGLQMVAGLSRDLGNVKKAAGMDSSVIHSYVHKLEMGINKIKEILSCERSSSQGKFFESMKIFLKEAEEEIELVKGAEQKSLVHVKEVTGYFHGDAAKEEAHPFRIFMVVRDFLGVLDRVCKEVENLEGRTMVGAASSFRMPTNASLPGSNGNGQLRGDSSDEDRWDRSS